MESTQATSKALVWVSYILQGLIGLLFLMGAVSNLMGSEESVATGMEMGYPEASLFQLGVVLLVSTLLYLIPRTRVLGAVLLTAWLGGAVATHIIHGDPLFNTVMPVVFGVLIWLALLLRDPGLRKFLF